MLAISTIRVTRFSAKSTPLVWARTTLIWSNPSVCYERDWTSSNITDALRAPSDSRNRFQSGKLQSQVLQSRFPVFDLVTERNISRSTLEKLLSKTKSRVKLVRDG